jgi:hypoxanthine phosphoribosyltransferase
MSGRRAAKVRGARTSAKGNAARGISFSSARIAARVAALGREIARAYHGRRLDIVVTLDRGFVFAADLIRQIDTPVVCHFVREDVRDVQQNGHARREVFFGTGPDLKGRDVLLVDAVIDSGVTQEFLLRRLGEGQPRSLRLAVLLDKPPRRRVGLEPDYFGFRTASNDVWVGYGLAAANGTGRNQKALSTRLLAAKRQGPKK